MYKIVALVTFYLRYIQAVHYNQVCATLKYKWKKLLNVKFFSLSRLNGLQ